MNAPLHGLELRIRSHCHPLNPSNEKQKMTLHEMTMSMMEPSNTTPKQGTKKFFLVSLALEAELLALLARRRLLLQIGKHRNWTNFWKAPTPP